MKDLFKYFDELTDAGFFVEITKKKAKIRAPDGQLFVSSLTPSCPHAHKNLFRDIRKYRKNQSYYLPEAR